MGPAIVKLYAECRPDDLQEFLSSSTDGVSTDVVKEYLTNLQRWNALAILHKNNREHQQALDIWRKLGTGQLPKDGTANPIEDSVKLLNKISDMTMLKEYSKWIFDANFKQFKNIWKREKNSEQVSPQLVIPFLNSFSPNTKAFYLKYLVQNLSSSDRQYHNALAECYVSALLDIINKEKYSASKLNAMEERLETGREKIMSKQRMKEKDISTEEAILKLRKKLLYHTRTYSYYLEPQPFLERIKDYSLRLEKIELFSIAGQYQEALRILLNEFEDPKRAETYCLQFQLPMHYEHDFDEITKGALTSFNNPTGENPRLYALFKLKIDDKKFDEAFQLLNQYPGSFNPVLVLNELPKTTPIKMISDFLINSVKETQHRYNQAIVTRNLETTSNKVLTQERGKIEMTYVKIERETVCDVTEERIGDQAFLRYPNGTLVLVDKKREFEYDKSVCPKTGRNFKTKPWDFTKNQ